MCSNLLEKEKRRDENKRGPGQGVRKSLVQQLKREERKKYRVSNRKEGGRNNIWREREKGTLLETQQAFNSQMGSLA